MKAEFHGGPLDGACIDVEAPQKVYYYPVRGLDSDICPLRQEHQYDWDGRRYEYKGATARKAP